MKNKKKIVAYGMATTMLLALCNMPVSSVQATSKTNEYVIVTEDELSCEEIVAEYKKDVISSDLEKENTVVADLTKQEVEKLEQDNDVWLVVDVWHYGQTPDAVEFYQPSHNKDKFRLFKFATYTSNADAENYAESATWYSNRTSD